MAKHPSYSRGKWTEALCYPRVGNRFPVMKPLWLWFDVSHLLLLGWGGDSYRKISGDTCSGGDVETRLEGEVVPCPLAGKKWFLALDFLRHHRNLIAISPGPRLVVLLTQWRERVELTSIIELLFPPQLGIQTKCIYGLMPLEEWKIFFEWNPPFTHWEIFSICSFVFFSMCCHFNLYNCPVKQVVLSAPFYFLNIRRHVQRKGLHRPI